MARNDIKYGLYSPRDSCCLYNSIMGQRLRLWEGAEGLCRIAGRALKKGRDTEQIVGGPPNRPWSKVKKASSSRSRGCIQGLMDALFDLNFPPQWPSHEVADGIGRIFFQKANPHYFGEVLCQWPLWCDAIASPLTNQGCSGLPT